ncbi:CdaR family protein [Paenibacillus sp. HB172176]|uniref:CdaR family protein n=1 Tax=Paenibacillus sp. HB172176 TaxID=2493690 RepID=UPI0014391F6E|nr:CdaR family protein [Paenibacillus sp. HB172176]
MDKWLSHPTVLKIISVVLALLLWAVVHIDPETSPQTTTSNTVTKVIEAATISATGLDPKKYKLTAMEPTVTRLVVEGRITSLYAATNEDYIVQVDVSNAKPGIQKLPLTVKLPSGIKEIELSPREVTVQLEKIETKSFDVEVMTEGKVADGMVLGTPEILTEGGSKVDVTLPDGDMSRVGVVGVSLDVSGATKTVENKKAKIVVYDTEGQEITDAVVDPQTIHVSAPVTLPSKQVPLQVRYTGSLPDNLSLVSIQPQLDQVTVYAPEDKLSDIQIYDGAVLDLSKVKETGIVKVKASPLDDIESVAPGEIEMMVVVEPTVTQTFNNVQVKVNGAIEGLTTEFVGDNGNKLSVKLKGAQTVLSGVKASDISASIKVDGLEPGEYTLPVDLGLPSYVQPVLEDDKPLTVTVDILDGSALVDPTDPGEDVDDDNTEATDPPSGGTATPPPATEEPTDTGKTVDPSDGSGNRSESAKVDATDSVNRSLARPGMSTGV